MPAGPVAFDEAVNDEILCQIFLFLEVDDLLVVPVVSSRWKNADANDELLWAPHVTALWKDKVINQPSEKVLRRRVRALPLSTLKRALCRVDISRCVEKPDFHNMLIARLIFGDRSPIKRQSRIFYPEWALRLGADDKFADVELVYDAPFADEV
jgi:F-box-like